MIAVTDVNLVLLWGVMVAVLIMVMANGRDR